MKIGIDLDYTICNTTEEVHNYLEKNYVTSLLEIENYIERNR